MQVLLFHLDGLARLNALRSLLNETYLVGIVGPVKAGKSTLRNILADLPHRGAPLHHALLQILMQLYRINDKHNLTMFEGAECV